MVAKEIGPIEKIEDIFVFPAPGSHEEQFWRAAAVTRDEFAPDVQDRQVILSRLDRSALDEEGPGGQFLVGRRFCP